MAKKNLPIIDLELRNHPEALKAWIKAQAFDLGFNDCVIAKPDARDHLSHFNRYLANGYHGDMTFLQENIEKRADPTLLVNGTQSIICVRLNYLAEKPQPRHIPDFPMIGAIARYAYGRDYHKIMRGKLKQLAKRIEEKIGSFSSRPFSDSAPIFEKTLAENAGMGWVGKHSLLINRYAGSFFVLGELFCDLALPFDQPTTAHCGSCTACQVICPTQAIVADGMLDARKCIAYLTIEYKGSFPLELRPLIGNRIFGCDDCQLICPWNRYAKPTSEADFLPRHYLQHTDLLTFWSWTEEEFLTKTEGSAIRRTGFQCFKRNVAVALGNAPYRREIVYALQQRQPQHQELVLEHQQWALQQQLQKQPSSF